MTCFGSPGTGTPQSKVVRLIDRSCRPRAHEADDLVAARLRADEIRIGLVMREQAVLIGGEAEEIALLLDPLDRRAAWRRASDPSGCLVSSLSS